LEQVKVLKLVLVLAHEWARELGRGLVDEMGMMLAHELVVGLATELEYALEPGWALELVLEKAIVMANVWGLVLARGLEKRWGFWLGTRLVE
jgi:hypothetical protein